MDVSHSDYMMYWVDFLKIRTNFMLSRQAFASLQHGLLRSVENVFIHNFVTPKWCMGK